MLCAVKIVVDAILTAVAYGPTIAHGYIIHAQCGVRVQCDTKSSAVAIVVAIEHENLLFRVALEHEILLRPNIQTIPTRDRDDHLNKKRNL